MVVDEKNYWRDDINYSRYLYFYYYIAQNLFDILCDTYVYEDLNNVVESAASQLWNGTFVCIE